MPGAVTGSHGSLQGQDRNVSERRCFTFGIGEGASTSLIKGMARAGNGTFEFITGKDRMQPKALRALKWSLQPTVKDVSLTWTLPSGVEAIVLSKVPTAIFQGQRSIVYAQLKGKVENEAEGEVCLRYKFKDEVVKNDIRFPLNVQNAERPTIHRLAAKALISELEHGTESQSEEVKKKILETSLQSGVVSSLTAYVAVNKDTKTRVEGPPVRRDVPAPAFMMMGSMPRMMACSAAPMSGHLGGYTLQSAPMSSPLGMMSRSLPYADYLNCEIAHMHGPQSLAPKKMAKKKSAPVPYSANLNFGIGDVQVGSPNMMFLPPPAPSVETPALVRLISLQNADGSWNLTPEFSAVLGISETDIKAKNPNQNVEVSVWVTVLAVIWLHTTSLDQREEWELLEGKAISWVRARAGSSLGEFVRVGNELLKSSVNPKVFGL